MALAATNPITNRPYSKGYKPGTESGAITLELVQRKDRVLLATVRSFTRPDTRYTIEVNCRTGQCRCSCEACRRAIEKNGYPVLAAASGYCKHIARWWNELAKEVIEINEAAKPKPQPKAETEGEHPLLTQVRQAVTRDELRALRTAVTELGKAYGLSLNYHEMGQGNKTYRALWNEIGHHVDFFRSTGREPLEPLAIAFLRAIGEVR